MGCGEDAAAPPPPAPPQGCALPADCTDGQVCLSGQCVAQTCTDAVKNEGETDLDCGGSSCPRCALGKSCTADRDCASGRCASATKICVVPPSTAPPSATADRFAGLTAVGGDVLANDATGVPDAVVVSFGGGDLGATAAAGSSVSLGGGTLQIRADGKVALSGAARGTYAVNYVIENAAGRSEARLELVVQDVVADRFETPDGVPLLADVTANDDQRFLVRSFGGGTLGGTPKSNASGDAAVTVAQGTVSLSGSGALTFAPAPGFVGAFTFSYVVQEGEREATSDVRIAVGGRGNLAFDASAETGAPVAGNTVSARVHGNDFDVVEPILVTELGAFDSGQDGFDQAPVVRLYDRDTQAEVAATTFPAGATARLVGTHRFVPLAMPLALPAGFRGSIVWEDAADAIHRQDVAFSAAVSRDAGGGTLSFAGLSGRDGPAGAYPTTAVGYGAAASFRFVRAAPAAAVLPDAEILAAVAEANQYRLVYDLAVPTTPSFNGSFDAGAASVPYATNASASVTRPFDRIAYLLRLDASYAWVSMDAFTRDAGRIGVPAYGSGGFFQRDAANAFVASNVGGVVVGSAAAVNLEFWPSNYGQANARAASLGGAVPNATDGAFDWGDSGANLSSGHGSMQIHAFGASQSVIAFSGWGTGTGSLGIGNRTTSHPDWTFANNAASFATRRLAVFVREVPP